MARVLWCEGAYWEEDSEEKWSHCPGRPLYVQEVNFVLNLLLIADWFSEPWHLVHHSLMGEQFQWHFKLHLIEMGQSLYIAGISSKSNIWTCDRVFCPVSHLHRRWEILFLCLDIYAFLETGTGKTELFLKTCYEPLFFVNMVFVGLCCNFQLISCKWTVTILEDLCLVSTAQKYSISVTQKWIME